MPKTNFNCTSGARKRLRYRGERKEFIISHEDLENHVSKFLNSGGKITQIYKIPSKVNHKIQNPVGAIENFLMGV